MGGMGVTSWSLLLIGLKLLVACCAASDHSPMMTSLFMHMNDLKKGTTKPIYLPKQDYSNTHFLPRDEADAIPFSSRHLPEILRLFAGSPMAASVADTISTSLESMLDFVFRALGISSHPPPTLLTTTFRSDHRETYQNYTITEVPEEVPASNMVGCHTLGYPYSVVYCHTQDGGNKAYRMAMIGDNGDIVDMYVVCHLDTSHWDPNGPSFAALGTRPGAPVCHVFPPHGNFLWIHNNDDKPTYI